MLRSAQELQTVEHRMDTSDNIKEIIVILVILLVVIPVVFCCVCGVRIAYLDNRRVNHGATQLLHDENLTRQSPTVENLGPEPLIRYSQSSENREYPNVSQLVYVEVLTHQ